MNILRQPELDEREFGRAAVRVDELKAWAASSRIMIPPTLPDLDSFEAIQLESLLCAFQAAAADYEGTKTSDRAMLAVAAAMLNDPAVPQGHPLNRVMIVEEQDARHARWFVGGEVHRQWRPVLERAIADGKLVTFDAQTGLPLGNTATAGAVEDPRWSAERLQELADHYQASKSLRRTASHFGIGETRVRQLLEKAGAKKAAQTNSQPASSPFNWRR